MTSKTRSALGTEQTTNFADNTTGAITPAIMRTTVQDMIDSTSTLLDPNTNTASTPSSFAAGLLGTTGGTVPGAGIIGEIVSSTILVGSAVPLVTGSAKDITSIAIGAGEWDIRGNVAVVQGSAMTQMYCWMSSTSATYPVAPNNGGISQILGSGAFVNTGTNIIIVGPMPFRSSVSATVYLSAQATFTASAAGYGFISARRMC